jgi:hypothetical protein
MEAEAEAVVKVPILWIFISATHFSAKL